MTLQQLKYFIAIADCGSINEAAKQLYISQPTLSNALRELETEIGLTLFARTNKGIHLLAEGFEFLGYARQVIEQTSLLEEKYLHSAPRKHRFCVSTQHYSFAVNAFISLIQHYGMEEYDFTLRETKTSEIIEDVKLLRSELGILFQNEFNRSVLEKIWKDDGLIFTPLFTARPHVFISVKNPLSQKDVVTLSDLEDYPCLSFEQGGNNSFYFAEEILSTRVRKKDIRVSDRATLFNLLIGLNGYTISSGILDEELNGKDITAVPLDINEQMDIGVVTRKNTILSSLGKKYLEALRELL